MHTITATTDIKAPIDTVWSMLTDLDRHHEWNPFMVAAEGSVQVGAKLRITMQPEGGRGMSFSPTVTEADAPVSFGWLGSVGFRGIFDGHHHFDLAPTDEGTRVTQSETFTGVLAWPILRMIGTRTERSFVAMNSALKMRAERAAHAS